MTTLNDIVISTTRMTCTEDDEKRFQGALLKEFKRGKSLRRTHYDTALCNALEALELLRERMPECPCNQCHCMDWSGIANAAIKELKAFLKTEIQNGTDGT
jgi:hypothetical protein